MLDGPLIALLMTFGVHVLGAVLLVYFLLGDEGWETIRGWWPRDDRPREPEPEPDGPRGGGAVLTPPVVAETVQSAVRLRGPGRLGDHRPLPARRPDHAPEPARRPRVPS